MAQATWKRGNELPPDMQREVLAMFVHRFTMEHVPNWARGSRPDGQPYRPQFSSDREWLANTLFAVTRRGVLDRRYRFCQTNGQTWPEGM